MPETSPGSAVPDYFADGWTGGRNRWAIALIVTMATFMEVLDTSIANVSLPHIAGSLSVTENESTWVLTSYFVSNAIVLPISGWLATKFGRKRYYMTCVALFTASSLLCGLAPSLGWLIFFRVLQGLGGGGLGPCEQAILVDTFPPAKRGMAMAVYGIAVTFAPAIGPTLGGIITDTWSWRWIFFINVPVGIASLLLSRRFVSDPPHLRVAKQRQKTIDWVGLSLVASGLGCLEVVLDKGQEEDWFHSSFIVTFMVIVVVSLTGFIVWEWRHKNPVVDIKMFKKRSFALANGLVLVTGMTLWGSTVLLPQYLQVFMGYTAQQAGMALSPGGLLVMALLPAVGFLMPRTDVRIMVTFGFVMVGAALLHMAYTINLGMDFETAVALRCMWALGMAFMFVPIQTFAYDDQPPEKSNQVSGIMNLSRNIGGDIGIAFVTTLVARRTQLHQTNLASHLTAYDHSYRDVVARLNHAFEHAGATPLSAAKQTAAVVYRQLVIQATQLAYLDALWVLAWIAVLTVPLVWLTRRPTTAGASGAH